MDRVTQTTGQVEKPGRLQLAIVEWQRMLVAKRKAQADRLICGAFGEDRCEAR